ncbi:MAG: NAD(P)-binding protein [Natronomonas sp.]
MSDTQDASEPRVVVVGGGVAGLTAGTYLARAGFDAVVATHGESILCRNAHLENVPGFPAGVNARTFLDLLGRQARRNGCPIEPRRVTDLRVVDAETHAFELGLEADDGPSEFETDYVLVASYPDVEYLRDVDVGLTARGSKTYVEIDDDGRTATDGLYAAGRIAGKPHQAVVAAGHGAEVAVTLIEDSDVPFYHDWVAPDGYFTDRGREVPPGCEEIDDEERRRRERASIEAMTDAFAEPQSGSPTMHPSVADDEE